MGIIVKSNIRKIVKELDKDNSISSVSDEVGTALERRVEELLIDGIKKSEREQTQDITGAGFVKCL